MRFLMQDRCALCSHRCQYYSQTMYEEFSIRENENKAFKNADAYLQKCKIINMTLDAQQFYRVYRDRRNNIHLSKNCEIITKDKCFTRSYSNQAVKFLSNFIDMLYENQREFVANNKCNSKQRRGI